MEICYFAFIFRCSEKNEFFFHIIMDKNKSSKQIITRKCTNISYSQDVLKVKRVQSKLHLLKVEYIDIEQYKSKQTINLV